MKILLEVKKEELYLICSSAWDGNITIVILGRSRRNAR